MQETNVINTSKIGCCVCRSCMNVDKGSGGCTLWPISVCAFIYKCITFSVKQGSSQELYLPGKASFPSKQEEYSRVFSFHLMNTKCIYSRGPDDWTGSCCALSSTLS